MPEQETEHRIRYRPNGQPVAHTEPTTDPKVAGSHRQQAREYVAERGGGDVAIERRTVVRSPWSDVEKETIPPKGGA